jgi:hypothetical protein
MSVELRFTSLGDVRAKRFHIWPASHSMLLAIFGMHLFSRWNIYPFLYTVFHKAGIAHSTFTASLNISTNMPYPMLLVVFSIHPNAPRNVRPFMHIVSHKVRIAHSIPFKTGHCML